MLTECEATAIPLRLLEILKTNPAVVIKYVPGTDYPFHIAWKTKEGGVFSNNGETLEGLIEEAFDMLQDQLAERVTSSQRIDTKLNLHQT